MIVYEYDVCIYIGKCANASQRFTKNILVINLAIDFEIMGCFPIHVVPLQYTFDLIDGDGNGQNITDIPTTKKIDSFKSIKRAMSSVNQLQPQPVETTKSLTGIDHEQP